MKKEITLKRKASAIVAMLLAVMVMFTAGIDSYADAKEKSKNKSYVDEVLEKAYNEVIEEDLYYAPIEEEGEVIKIYNSDYELLEELVLGVNDQVANKDSQMLLNRAEFLSSYGNTSVYKVLK